MATKINFNDFWFEKMKDQILAEYKHTERGRYYALWFKEGKIIECTDMDDANDFYWDDEEDPEDITSEEAYAFLKANGYEVESI